MELRHVRTFLALAEELHFGRAARKLRVAQSAVSQTLRALEEEVGVTLLERSKRKVSLTPAGAQYLEHARAALAQLEQGAAAALSAASGEVGDLRLSFTLMSALTVLPRVVTRFKRHYPRVRVTITPGGSTEQLEAIAQERCDVGFMAFKRDVQPLETLVVARAALVAVLPSRHPLSKRSRVELGELAGESFIFLKQQSEPQVHEHFRAHCVRAGFEPRFVMEVEHVEALLAFVAAGFGVSCVPDFVQQLRFHGVKTVPLALEARGGISAVWHPKRLSPTAAQFLELLRAELAHRET
ncbi:MAG: LysR family transcriptional regulator [Myxococcales bacterium]|nr:MAG: LysR family transcriptional regulator [Myxococcales bacterium]